jgi:phenylalanyl-tRNA synthetase alpha chain
LENTLAEIEKEALELISAAGSKDELEQISIRFLGRKGELTGFLRNISSLPEAQRPAAGKDANLLKIRLENEIGQAEKRLAAESASGAEGIDVTLPGRPAVRGSLHPVTQVMDEICGIFSRLDSTSLKGRKLRPTTTTLRP